MKRFAIRYFGPCFFGAITGYAFGITSPWFWVPCVVFAGWLELYRLQTRRDTIDECIKDIKEIKED
jgi:uncharacterized membrane protein